MERKGSFMRLIMISFLVLACAAVWAEPDVLIDAYENGDGTFDITMDVTGDSIVRGVALKVACTDSELVDLSFDADVKFNTFIDYLYSNPGTEFDGDTPAQEGHPYADATGPGVAVVGATEFSISMAVLDPTGNQAGIGAGTYLIATVNLGVHNGEICIGLDTLRGGIVGDHPITTNLDDEDLCTMVEPPNPCWIYYPCFPYGDANGDGFITSLDVQVVLNSWGGYDHCADFNKDGFVTSLDVQILLNSWGKPCP